MKNRTNFLKKLVAMMMCLLLATGTLSLCASASVDYKTEGTLGENITWKFTPETGELRVSGTGDMYDHLSGANISGTADYMWYDFWREVKSLVIEDGITYIGNFVFNGLPNLTSLYIGNTVEEIGQEAFYSCSRLTTVHIPASVYKIHLGAFGYCKSIKKFTVDSGNNYYKADTDGVLFSKDGTELVAYPLGREATTYTVPSGVLSVGAEAFAHASLSEVTLPYGLTDIKTSAFERTAIEEIVFPETLKTIYTSAFYFCPNISEVVIPENVESIGSTAFSRCESLESFTLPESFVSVGENILRSTPFSYNPDNWFQGGLYCGRYLLATDEFESDTFVTKQGTKYIATRAFLGATAKTYIISDTVADVNGYAFWGNDSVETVVFAGSVKRIGSYAFWGSDVKEVVFCEGIEEIGNNAFWGANCIESVVIPSTVERVGNLLFYGAKNLKSVTLYNTLEAIYENVFYATDALTDIYFYGTEEEWKIIYHDHDVESDWLEGVTIHYLSEDAPAHVHEFNTFVTVDPSCNSYGYKVSYCIGCGASNFVEGYDMLSHDYGEWVVTKPATETENGIETSTCSICGDEKTREIDKNIHVHKYVETVVPATCTEEGYTLYLCSCGDKYKTETTAVLGHLYGSWVVVKEATEHEYGLKVKTCRRCGHEHERSISPILGSAHVLSKEVFEATCTENGYTKYTCECGYSYVSDIVAAHGHEFSEWTEVTAPTATQNGLETRFCYLCGEVEEREISSTGHEHVYVSSSIESTCTTVGYLVYTCSCGEKFKLADKPALGHNFGSWTVTVDPTETQNGIETRTCVRCGETEEREIGFAEHIHVYDKVVTEATCTAAGYITYICNCGDSFVSGSIPALGHSFGKWTVIIEPTETQKGLEIRTCTLCGISETREPDVVEHKHSYRKSVVDATCAEKGYTEYVCDCGYSYTSNETPALGHNFGDWIVTKEPTQTEYGTMMSVCDRCGASKTGAIDKLPSDSDEAVITVNGATTSAGKTVEVKVTIANNPGLVATHITLNYDKDVLTLTEVKNGTVIGNECMLAGKDLTAVPYNVIWSDALAENDYTDDGLLVTFVFKVADDAPEGKTAVSVDYYEESTFNCELEEVVFIINNGEIEIADRIAGDVNGDGEVNLRDAVYLERYLAGGWGVSINDRNADVNGDGAANLVDAVLIKRHLAGWGVSLI